ncbi:MAG: DEAD/DEAH box helicase [Xanthomonadales bacterium]|nr:DEAD/DEAH box helicase [Xanthomonadales bacterium]
MFPSILAAEIRASTRHFLVSAFEAADPFFHGVIQRHVDREEGLDKGPYLQLGLPFRPGSDGKGFFGSFELAHAGYAHQEAAWRRLASNREAANTLVATGTGSGKTECFLFPLLDHCRRVREAAKGEGAEGIKALVIYPMNALASDQARRFAEVIAQTPAFSGLRVGLYVGGGGRAEAVGEMSATEVITDREVLRKAPPDVLLTNYKMLDYLLIRPKDRALWAKNGPQTLRYVVVDELHSFDGAQGTDLSLLLRRLRARLGTPEGHLIGVGTSATLGDGDTGPLREYAAQIFASPFPVDSVITESRDSVAEFLGEQPIVHLMEARPDLAAVLDPASHADPVAAITAWFGLFFPSEPTPADARDPAWRQGLGPALKQHLLLHNLLRLLKGEVGHLPTLQHQLIGSLPELARPHASRVLDAFLALVAWARSAKDPGQPLVTVRLQLWLRELRRLVANVTRADQVALQSESDLKPNSGRIHLPLVQCSECRSTGWLAMRVATSPRLISDLDGLYNAWFRAAPEVSRLYPVEALIGTPDSARCVHVCGQCGQLQDESGECGACGHPETLMVWEVRGQVQSQREGAVFNWHEKRCPACGAQDRLLLVGARNATLGAQIIEQSWASPYNDDKKLIAFSDSVQDAAHRAGFFGGRTYRNNIRMAMSRVIAAEATPSVVWSRFLQRLPEVWRHESDWSTERFVTEFIGPNMQWQQEWVQLQEQGHIDADGALVERVAKRLGWQAVAEFTYLSARGRTLERVGVATLAPAPRDVEAVIPELQSRLAEDLGLRQLTADDLRHWLWGFLLYLRRRGAVTHPDMEAYFREGNFFAFSSRGGRDLWLPGMTQWGPHPVFLSLGDARYSDRLVPRSGQSWYQRWLAAVLGRHELLMPKGIEDEAYGIAIELLCAQGVLDQAQSEHGRSVGLARDRLWLDTRVAMLRSSKGRRRLAVPAGIADHLLGMPCLDAMQESYSTFDLEAEAERWMARRYAEGDLRRVVPAEHTGLLLREAREQLELRFKAKPEQTRPWYENLLSATPTLEMGVDIGSLSSVMLCSVPPSQASFLQRIGRAGRRDGNAMVVTLADGASPHDLYFYEQPMEMMAGQVTPPGVFLEAAEVLRRQLMAFCIDGWVATGIPDTAFPDKTGPALDAVEKRSLGRFPYNLLDFMQADDAGLLDRFFALLGDVLTERVRDRLRDYMLGSSEVDSLRSALLKLLEELMHERAAHRKRAQALRTRMTQLAARTQDEASQNELADLKRERDKALELAREITSRELLATLTDAGLIPNYAFPEAGIELKSFIWRRRSELGDGERAYVSLPAERYERPASSALSELAPENRFYANRRKVEIDQINMQLAKIEPWRLCPRCHHSENLNASGDPHSSCPRCGEVMWANVAQKRMLLRFRQAMASAEDGRSRIDDTSDDREPKFFLRQLLVDFEPGDVSIAWKLESDSVAFGFEFIRRAVFRDINFGERGRTGESFRVADRDLARPGFKLCQHCGMVQKPPRQRRESEEARAQDHARDCLAYGDNNPDHIVDCLYLYREFSSEALRILVPYTRSGMDETVLQSFMAALQLGLKRRFGGKVDHLRITTQEQPEAEGGGSRQYVLIYDAVPGGTGYLHQLLSEEAQSLSDVLKMAHEAVRSCGCREQPDKDGCYRCLYQYRQGRAMASVSRRVAEEVLGQLVESLAGLVRVPSISQILINPNFDSVLESQFIESLRRLNGSKGANGLPDLPTVRLVQEIIDGTSGFMLEVGTQRWWVKPQVDLGPDEGVRASCRPDFLLVPARSAGKRRPIAVFADGWSYHQHLLREDARKRSALVASGRYWVWSVTWEDVQRALERECGFDLDVIAEHARLPANHQLVTTLAGALGMAPDGAQENAVARLVRFLAQDPEGADQYLARQAALSTVRLTVEPKDPSLPAIKKAFEAIRQSLPDEVMDGAVDGRVSASSSLAGPLKLHSLLLQEYFSGRLECGCGAVVLDPVLAGDNLRLRPQWRAWLQAYNTLQGLPNHYLMEASGQAHGDYSDLVETRTLAPEPSTAPSASPWSALISSLVAELVDGAKALEAEGCPAPEEIGFELSVDGETVEAQAELAWLQGRLVVLTRDQIEYQDAWLAHHWQVVLAADEHWPAEVLRVMEITQ